MVILATVAVRRIHDTYTLTQLFSLIYLCNVLEHAHLLRSLPLLLESSRKQVTTYWWLACETNTAFTHTRTQVAASHYTGSSSLQVVARNLPFLLTETALHPLY